MYTLNLVQNKDEVLKEHAVDFEMIGSMLICELEQKTYIRIRNVEGFETYINAIDVDYGSGDVIFTRWSSKLNTPHFNRVDRAQFGRGTDFKQDIIEYTCNNRYNPTSSQCFIKCNIHLTGNDYTEDFLTFIRTEQRRSNVRTTAKVQSFFKIHTNNIGCYVGLRVCPRNIAEKI